MTNKKKKTATATATATAASGTSASNPKKTNRTPAQITKHCDTLFSGLLADTIKLARNYAELVIYHPDAALDYRKKRCLTVLKMSNLFNVGIGKIHPEVYLYAKVLSVVATLPYAEQERVADGGTASFLLANGRFRTVTVLDASTKVLKQVYGGEVASGKLATKQQQTDWLEAQALEKARKDADADNASVTTRQGPPRQVYKITSRGVRFFTSANYTPVQLRKILNEL